MKVSNRKTLGASIGQAQAHLEPPGIQEMGGACDRGILSLQFHPAPLKMPCMSQCNIMKTWHFQDMWDACTASVGSHGVQEFVKRLVRSKTGRA